MVCQLENAAYPIGQDLLGARVCFATFISSDYHAGPRHYLAESFVVFTKRITTKRQVLPEETIRFWLADCLSITGSYKIPVEAEWLIAQRKISG
jgi:hypothetical protein